MAISRLSIIKFLELAITIVCIGLQHESMIEPSNFMLLLVCGTFVGYFVILVALFAGHILQTPVNKRLDIFFSLLGCALFVASGAFIIQNFNDRNFIAKAIDGENFKTLVMSKASLAIINGGLFLVDGFFTIRD